MVSELLRLGPRISEKFKKYQSIFFQKRKNSALLNNIQFVFNIGELSLLYINTKTSDCLKRSDKICVAIPKVVPHFLNNIEQCNSRKATEPVTLKNV